MDCVGDPKTRPAVRRDARVLTKCCIQFSPSLFLPFCSSESYLYSSHDRRRDSRFQRSRVELIRLPTADKANWMRNVIQVESLSLSGSKSFGWVICSKRGNCNFDFSSMPSGVGHPTEVDANKRGGTIFVVHLRIIRGIWTNPSHRQERTGVRRYYMELLVGAGRWGGSGKAHAQRIPPLDRNS